MEKPKKIVRNKIFYWVLWWKDTLGFIFGMIFIILPFFIWEFFLKDRLESIKKIQKPFDFQKK
jgi:hypothetical protein